MKRKGNLWKQVVSDENLLRAIDEVNRSHRWKKGHKPNPLVVKIESNKLFYLSELKRILENGFVPQEPKVVVRYDVAAKKERTISMPSLWPDQYVHHALIQVLEPILLPRMDNWACGSIPGRGPIKAKIGIEKWLKYDPKGTKYELNGDIRHFYDSLTSEVVISRLKCLIKDHKAIDLAERIVSQGVLIGVYSSQWFANMVLQPLDEMIRQSKLCKHYVRYMDNLTIFGSNKRNLRKLKTLIEKWLSNHRLKLKNDWQIFPTDKRLPDAVGFRYGHGYTLVRKSTLLRTKRHLSKFKKKKALNKPVSYNEAAGLLSRLGQLRHCNNTHLYANLYQGEKIERQLKQVVRKRMKGLEEWNVNTYLTMMALLKYYEQYQMPVPQSLKDSMRRFEISKRK